MVIARKGWTRPSRRRLRRCSEALVEQGDSTCGDEQDGEDRLQRGITDLSRRLAMAPWSRQPALRADSPALSQRAQLICQRRNFAAALPVLERLC